MLGWGAEKNQGYKLAELPLIIGAAMIVAGLGLGIYITVRIVEQRRADRDEPLD